MTEAVDVNINDPKDDMLDSAEIAASVAELAKDRDAEFRKAAIAGAVNWSAKSVPTALILSRADALYAWLTKSV